MNRVVWIRQGLVGTLFLLAGTIKLMTPVSVLAMQSSIPGEVLRVIGALEVLGAMVLLLPVLVRLCLELKSWAPLVVPVSVAGAMIGTLVIGIDVLALLVAIGTVIVLVAYGQRHVRQTCHGRLTPAVQA